jgi:hypothetical protein
MLHLKILNSNTSLNNLDFVTSWQFNPGDSASVYLQIVDLDSNGYVDGMYNRYVPLPGSTLYVTLPTADNMTSLSFYASNPFPSDTSIFQITLTPSQSEGASTGVISAVLTEGAGYGSPTITSISRVSNVVVANTSSPHGLALNDIITVSGVTDTSFNGVFQVLATPTTTSVVWQQTGANASSSGGLIGGIQPSIETIYSDPLGVIVGPSEPYFC